MAKRGLEYLQSNERRLLLDIPLAMGILGTIGIIGAVPLSIASVVASRSWPLLRQQRIGLGGEAFSVWKFRSLPVPKAANGQHQIFGNDDPRANAVGRFMRTFGADELPQVFSILSGKMSAIGPRPLLPEDHDAMRNADPTLYSEVKPYYEAVRPGWQSTSMQWRHRAVDATATERHIGTMEMDLEFFKNASPEMDLRVLASAPTEALEVCARQIGSRLLSLGSHLGFEVAPQTEKENVN